MTDRIDPASLTDVRDQAAYWFARQQSRDVTPTERQAFLAWRAAHPDHDAQYRQVERILDVAGAMPADALQTLGVPARPAPQAAHRLARRRLAWGLGMACAGLAGVAVLDPAGWRTTPDFQAAFSTDHGKRRQIMLPDDSVVILNTDTRLVAAFYPDRRVLRLEQGEALFLVQPDAKAPFIVDAGRGQVKVTGTQFSVRRDDGAFSVAVLEGSVEVSTGAWWRRSVTALRAGDAARAGVDGGMRVQSHADVQAMTAWRDGKLVFRGVPLADAVREINRYALVRIIMPQGQIAGLKVSGVFDLDDPQAFLAALPHIVPVRVRTLAGGQAEILPH